MSQPTNEEMRYRLLRQIFDPVERLSLDFDLQRLPPVPDEAPEADEDRLDRPFFEVLGLDADWASEESAPPVDGHLVAKAVLGELSGEELDQVLRRMARYRCWFDALCRFREAGE
jgi:hypothetical protein